MSRDERARLFVPPGVWLGLACVWLGLACVWLVVAVSWLAAALRNGELLSFAVMAASVAAAVVALIVWRKKRSRHRR
jgi:hypothetical protein